MIKHLSELTYDGGSDIGNLEFPSGCDKILWFTDGFSTLSEDVPTKLPNAPVLVFVDAPKVNAKTLKFVSNKTGGQYFNLLETESDSDIVSAATGSSNFKFLFTEYDKSEIVDVFPESSAAVQKGIPFSFISAVRLKLLYRR